MATYAIGDVQGCFSPLEKLLTLISFDASKDTLWFTGDLVNRGDASLETLRFVKSLGPSAKTVLGNHDLHLLAVAAGAHEGWQEDTLQDILRAADRDDLLGWLQQQPLILAEQGYVMVHAGLAPSWDLETAQRLAGEVSAALRSDAASEYFNNMYGNEPSLWQEALTGMDRLRCITNYFTRARFCREDGSLELKSKGTLGSKPSGLTPWFDLHDRKSKDLNIIFGHWAALGGVTNVANTFALDTGCVWGFALTAMRLEDKQRFQVDCNV